MLVRTARRVREGAREGFSEGGFFGRGDFVFEIVPTVLQNYWFVWGLELASRSGSAMGSCR